MAKDAEGYFFIDQPYELFVVLLDHLRAQILDDNGHSAERLASIDPIQEFRLERVAPP